MQTFPSDTRTVTIAASRDAVFDYLSDPLNLPEWAVHFCQWIREEGDGWRVMTPSGPPDGLRMDVHADAATGVVDYEIEPEPGVRLPAHSRVVANGEGAEVLFTQYRFPSLNPEQFEQQVESLQEELEVLAQHFQEATAT